MGRNLYEKGFFQRAIAAPVLPFVPPRQQGQLPPVPLSSLLGFGPWMSPCNINVNFRNINDLRDCFKQNGSYENVKQKISSFSENSLKIENCNSKPFYASCQPCPLQKHNAKCINAIEKRFN